jgi:hypothetical protein
VGVELSNDRRRHERDALNLLDAVAASGNSPGRQLVGGALGG